jgi:DNA-binding transcriptional LysR family regulator
MNTSPRFEGGALESYYRPAMDIDINELRVLKTVVEENGFNRAARRLHRTQSAISQSVANLEHKLDTPLIVRGPPLSLTAAGERLLAHASVILREQDAVLEDLRHIVRAETERLSIATNATIAHFFGEQLLSRFCELHPDCKLKVDVIPSREIVSSVINGRYELGFGPFQHRMPGEYVTQELFREQRHLVMSPKHEAYEKTRDGGQPDLSRFVLITSYLDDPELRPSMDRLRNAFREVWEVSDMRLRFALVNRGFGATFVGDRNLREHELCTDMIPVKGFAFSVIERRVGLYHSSRRALSSGAQAFVELCTSFWSNTQ